MTRKKNFTFPELVVILVIFGIGIVLAAEIANHCPTTKQCINNLRKIRQAQMLYATENNGQMAVEIFLLQPLLGFKTTETPDVTGCPAVANEQKRKFFYATEYGKNIYIFTAKKFWAGNPENPDEIRNKLSDYASPEKTMIYMDFPPEPNGGLGAVHCNSAFLKTKAPAAFRHEGKVNTVFLDGHVETISAIPNNNASSFWGL